MKHGIGMAAGYIALSLTLIYVSYKVIGMLASSVVQEEPGIAILLGVLLFVICLSVAIVAIDEVREYIDQNKRNNG